MTGIVTDQSGARLSNARVSAVNEDAGASRKAAAGEDGVYTIPDLGPGSYSMRSLYIKTNIY